MKRFVLFSVVFLVVFCFTYSQAQATLITYCYGGEITSVDPITSGGSVSGDISVGERFTGSFTYDLSCTDTDPLSTYFWGVYDYKPAGLNGISLQLVDSTGNIQTDPDGEFIVTIDNLVPGEDPPDPLQLDGDSVLLLPWNVVDSGVFDGSTHFSIRFLDYDGTSFADDSLPTVLALSMFDNNSISITTAQDYVGGTIDTLVPCTSEPIPEPSTILLLTTGLGGIVACGKLKIRRRKKMICR